MTQTKQVEQLKLNVTNIHSFLVKENKRKEKLSAKKEDNKKRKISFQKKQQKEKQLEANKAAKSEKNAGEQVIKTSSMSLLDKLFNFGGLLIGGILVNAADGIVKEGKKFYADNKELFDTIGNFLTGVKDAIVGLLDSFTGPYAEEGAFDDFAKFSDDGKLQSGALKKVEEAYEGLDRLILKVDKMLGGKQVLAMKDGVEGIKSQRTGIFVPQKFTNEERERYASQSGQRMLETPVSTPDDDTFYEGEKRSQSSNFNKIYNLAVKHGAKFPEVVAAQAMHETGFMNPNLPSVFNSTGGTNPFGQTGDRGYGTIKREGSPASGGWTLYPSLDVAVKDHIALWHRTSNHPQNYEAFDKAIDGIAAVAPVYSPDADPANIKLGYTADGYSSAMVKILKSNGFDPYKVKPNKPRKPQPKITPVPNNRDDQARVLNQRDPRGGGGGGSTTVALQRVNTIQTVPYMMPVPTKSRSSSTSQPQLPSIWSA